MEGRRKSPEDLYPTYSLCTHLVSSLPSSPIMPFVTWCSSMLAYFAPGDVTVIFSTFAIAALVLGVVLGLSIVSSSHDLHRIPGPPGIPVLGNLLDVGHPQAHQTIAAWAQKWPLYKFKLLGTSNVVVTDPAEIAPLLARGPQELPKAWDIYTPLDPVSGGCWAGVHSPCTGGPGRRCGPSAAVPAARTWKLHMPLKCCWGK